MVLVASADVLVSLGRLALELEDEVRRDTISYGIRGDLVVYVGAEGAAPSDADWDEYVAWLTRYIAAGRQLKGLVLARDHAPSARQRSYFSANVSGGEMSLAVLIGNRRLMPIVQIFMWFIPNTRAFAPGEVREALAYLNVEADAELLACIDGFRRVAAPARAAP